MENSVDNMASCDVGDSIYFIYMLQLSRLAGARSNVKADVQKFRLLILKEVR